MADNLDSYAKAYVELENNEKDIGTWAKAFAETTSEDEAKKLYIKLRVEQLEANKTDGKPPIEDEPESTPKSEQITSQPFEHTASGNPLPTVHSKTKNTFDFKSMSWPDKIAWLVACCAVGVFVANVGTTLAMGMSIDLYKVFTGHFLLYIGFPFAMWRLISHGYFNRWFPDSSGKTDSEKKYNDLSPYNDRADVGQATPENSKLASKTRPDQFLVLPNKESSSDTKPPQSLMASKTGGEPVSSATDKDGSEGAKFLLMTLLIAFSLIFVVIWLF